MKTIDPRFDGITYDIEWHRANGLLKSEARGETVLLAVGTHPGERASSRPALYHSMLILNVNRGWYDLELYECQANYLSGICTSLAFELKMGQCSLAYRRNR